MSKSAFDLSTVISDAKKIIFSPVNFYREMPVSGGFVNPLLFVIVMAVITGLILGVYSLIGLGMNDSVGLSIVILMPILGVIGSFIGAAILFVIWKLMGSEKSYEVAYRCIAYSFVVAPVAAVIVFIPYLAGILKTLWVSLLLFIASVEVHKLKAQTAKIVFGVLAAIGLLWGVGAEHTARNFSKHMEKIIDQSGLSKMIDVEKMEDMTPEEIGEKVGEFMKGLEKGAKE